MDISAPTRRPARAAAALALAVALLLPATAATAAVTILRDEIVSPGAAAGLSTLVEAADLDQDGRPDLLVLDATADGGPTTRLDWYLTQADGSIQHAGTLTTGEHDFAGILVKDVTGDGKVDLVVSSHVVEPGGALGGSIWLYPGDGAGHFGAPAPIVTGADGPFAARVTDYDGDGANDILVWTTVDLRWRIMRGHGDGTFEDAFIVPPAVGPPGGWQDLGSIDVTGDGRPDVIGRTEQGVDIFPIPAAGGTVAPVSLFCGTSTATQAEGDLDGDGLADIGIRTFDSRLWRIRSLGGGAFDAQPLVSYLSPGYAFGMADIDGDGKADILTPLKAGAGPEGGIFLLRSPGFGPLPGTEILSTGAPITGWWIEDMNGDGRPDIVDGISGLTSTTVQYHQFEFGPFEERAYPVLGKPGALAVADFDGDGKLDVAVIETQLNDVAVLRGDGAGGFSRTDRYPVGVGANAIAAARLRMGGSIDLVTSDGSDQTVSLLRGFGDGTFAARQTYFVGRLPLGVALGDFDGDALPDILVTVYGQDALSLLVGDGAGHFGPLYSFATGAGPRAPIGRDLDGDGLLDLAYADEFSNLVVARLQDRALGLGPEQGVLTVARPRAVVALDLDRNGVPLLGGAGLSASTIELAHRNPDGGYTQFTHFGVGPGYANLASADFDGDALPDLAGAQTASTGAGALSLVSGAPGTTFGPLTQWSAELDAGGMGTGDMNGDGRPDLVVANTSRNTITVLLNRNTGPIVSVPGSPGVGAALAIARLAPNPSRAGEVLAADVTVPGDGALAARVISLAGRTLWERTLAARAGSQRVALGAGAKLAPGVYWLDVRFGGGRAAQKFVVLP